jgi:aryl-alcohol dehydrogenase-like predicted oxidoreductase
MENGGMMRQLGRSGIAVSALGVGCWAIGGKAWRGETPVGWGEVDDDESIRAIDCAIDLGVNFFDTADVYGAGHSERVVGRALAAKRQQVVIATKFGNGYDEATKQLAGAFASPEYIRKACDRSLARLGTDYIDLYQFHIGNYELEAVPEILDTLEGLAAAGKIRAYGWSTDDPERARAFAAGAHCAAVQVQLNVLDDNPAMVALCEALNLAGINRGPLAMGLLTGKYDSGALPADDDVRGSRGPDWMKYFRNGRPNPEWNDKIGAIREALTTGGRTLAQGALAWLWARSQMMVPIPGIRTVKQARENAGAMRFGPLPAEAMAQIEQAMGRG